MSTNIKAAVVENSTDKTKTLVKVRFTPQVPDPSRQADIEAIFEYQNIDVYVEGAAPSALIPLSCTNCDTREPYKMTDPQRNAIMQAAMQAIADEW